MDVFADNLRALLLAAPLGSRSVLGIDPGLRTGCKCAAVDATGKYFAVARNNYETEVFRELEKPADKKDKGKFESVRVFRGRTFPSTGSGAEFLSHPSIALACGASSSSSSRALAT